MQASQLIHRTNLACDSLLSGDVSVTRYNCCCWVLWAGRHTVWMCVKQHNLPGEWPGWASACVAPLWEHQAKAQNILRLLLLLYHIRSTFFFPFLSSRFGKASSKWTKGARTVSDADAPGKSTAAFPHPTRAIEQGQCAGGAYTWEERPFSETCGIWGFQQGNVSKLWAWWECILLRMSVQVLLAKSWVI